MAIVVDVSLLSGLRASSEADLSASLQSLAERAQRALGVCRRRLFSSRGCVLDGDMQLGAAKLQTGGCLTLHAGTVRIRGNDGSFVAILGDWSVVTWGNGPHGGDSSSVKDQLKNVQHIQASVSAFAAILGDGSVVT